MLKLLYLALIISSLWNLNKFAIWYNLYTISLDENMFHFCEIICEMIFFTVLIYNSWRFYIGQSLESFGSNLTYLNHVIYYGIAAFSRFLITFPDLSFKHSFSLCTILSLSIFLLDCLNIVVIPGATVIQEWIFIFRHWMQKKPVSFMWKKSCN